MPSPSTESSTRLLTTAICAWLQSVGRASSPLVVAIDGPSSAGKTTLAQHAMIALAARGVAGALLHTDDFLLGAHARLRAPEQGLSDYYDWARLRREALEPLRDRRAARFEAFDWRSDSFRAGVVELAPAELVVLEGVGSGAPALEDLVARTVFVQTAARIRRARTRRRIPAELWDARWLACERSYFCTRSAHTFDLVIPGSDR